MAEAPHQLILIKPHTFHINCHLPGKRQIVVVLSEYTETRRTVVARLVEANSIFRLATYIEKERMFANDHQIHLVNRNAPRPT